MASPLNKRLVRLIVSARAAIAWERLWPAIAPMVAVIVLFVASALMGLWIGLPVLAKVLGLLLFAGLFGLAAMRLRGYRPPDREEALRRLEDDAQLSHRPLGAYEDTLAAGGDGTTEALWRVHRKRARERLDKLRVAVPQADLVPHDPFAMRAAVGIVLFVGIAVGAGAVAERLITPFDFREPNNTVDAAQFRLDAWVTPPSYTGRSPLFLSSKTRVETADGIRVPAGSTLTVRAQGAADVDLYVSAETQTGPQEMPPLSDGSGAAALQAVVPIEGAMVVEVRRGGETIDAWRFVADGDLPPSAILTEPPKANNRDGFELRYALDDDYGIASAEGIVIPLQAGEGRRPLVENPSFALALPAGAGMRGAGRHQQDLAAHPFAGLDVSVKVRATDGIGQTGYSAPRDFRLPARTFVNEMAKAVVEQRQILALDANSHLAVIDAFDLLLSSPEDVGGPGAFLAVSAAYRDLVAARDDDALREMLEKLWQLALMLEDDGMSDVERALAAAQERLREALENGAPEDEIARLTQELREAMQRYMQALAERMQQNPQQQQAMDPNAQQLSQGTLEDMLQRIEELARQGRHEEAEQLLSQLQQMMQNLQMAQPGQGQQGDPMGQSGRTLDELGRMIQRQQQLMDETQGMQPGQPGQQGQQGQQPGQQQGQMGQQPGQQPGQGRMPGQGQGQMQGQLPGQQPGQGQMPGQGQTPGQGMTPSERADAMARLQQEQRSLQQDLDNLMRQLEQQGFDPGGRLGDAEQSMGEAGDALGDGQSQRALGDQGDALQALREGAQSMAQQMAEAQQGGGEGEQMGSPDAGPGRDPLGRARREGGFADTSRVAIPDEIDTQRARRILQFLRERLGDVGLPRIERDYLERLLP